MASFDGTGALEARLEAARQKMASQESARDSEAASAAAKQKAEVAAHAEESAALVREFIERAKQRGIRPVHRLPRSVERTIRYSRRPQVKSERKLDRSTTACWHLGRDVRGEKSLAYPSGDSFNYFLSETGFHLDRQIQTSSFRTWSGEERTRQIVSWVPRVPHMYDVVYTIPGYDYNDSTNFTLVEAMVEFFQKHEG